MFNPIFRGTNASVPAASNSLIQRPSPSSYSVLVSEYEFLRTETRVSTSSSHPSAQFRVPFHDMIRIRVPIRVPTSVVRVLIAAESESLTAMKWEVPNPGVHVPNLCPCLALDMQVSVDVRVLVSALLYNVRFPSQILVSAIWLFQSECQNCCPNHSLDNEPKSTNGQTSCLHNQTDHTVTQPNKPSRSHKQSRQSVQRVHMTKHMSG